MVFDRTRQDVENSISIINDKIKKFIEITEEEENILARGTLNIQTLNRIEEKQAEISRELKEMGYFGEVLLNKTWDNNSIFYLADLERIIKNCQSIKNSFYYYDTTPKSANAVYHYEEINKIEKMLNDVENMIDEVKSLYNFCGSFYCGEF